MYTTTVASRATAPFHCGKGFPAQACAERKISFEAAKLAGNAQALLAAILKAKPAAAKGKYVKKVTLTSTMGPGILIDPAEVEAAMAVAA